MNLVSFTTDTHISEGTLYHISVYDKDTFTPVEEHPHLTTGLRIFRMKNIKAANNLLVSGKSLNKTQRRKVFEAMFEKEINWL